MSVPRSLWQSGQLARDVFRAAVTAPQCSEADVRLRAEWLHNSAQTILHGLRLKVTAAGTFPASGLLVSNHLTYLDVLVYGSLFPCIFVAKRDVRHWPVFGHLTEQAGTIFIDRERWQRNDPALRRLEAALAAKLIVVLFPEGTSSDGTELLPFRSPLFQTAIRMEAPITAAAVRYSSTHAGERQLAYYGDAIFAPHLFRTLGQRNLSAEVAFAPGGRIYSDRKQAARESWSLVAGLRVQMHGRPRCGSQFTMECGAVDNEPCRHCKPVTAACT